MVFGLHGHAITLGIVAPIWFCHGCPAASAYAAGVDLPNITGFAFFMTYGAAGDLLPLAIMLAFFAKSARYKTLGKIALPPAIFTIGEPMAYGVPLVMNFTLAIPYIFINGIMLGIAWYLTVIGVLPRVAGVVPRPACRSLFLVLCRGAGNCRFPIYRTFARFAGWYFFFKTADLVACREENQTDTI